MIILEVPQNSSGATGLAGQLDLFGPFEQRLKYQAKFEPRQMRTSAMMLAFVQSEVFVRRR